MVQKSKQPANKHGVRGTSGLRRVLSKGTVNCMKEFYSSDILLCTCKKRFYSVKENGMGTKAELFGIKQSERNTNIQIIQGRNPNVRLGLST
jgi:hypothetical protein